MPHLDPDKLNTLLGQTLNYQGIPCRIIEILADEPALVLRGQDDRRILQANQYGDAGDWLPQTFTVTVFNDRRDGLNPDLADLAAFGLFI